jgi:ribosomal protein S18 acetylase RimI-like enzyme
MSFIISLFNYISSFFGTISYLLIGYPQKNIVNDSSPEKTKYSYEISSVISKVDKTEKEQNKFIIDKDFLTTNLTFYKDLFDNEYEEYLTLHEEAFYPGFTGYLSYDDFMEKNSENNDLLYRVYYENKLIASLTFEFKNLLLTNVAVKKDYRRQGIATFMLENFNTLMKHQFDELKCEVNIENKGAKALYLSVGFEETKNYRLRGTEPMQELLFKLNDPPIHQVEEKEEKEEKEEIEEESNKENTNQEQDNKEEGNQEETNQENANQEESNEEESNQKDFILDHSDNLVKSMGQMEKKKSKSRIKLLRAMRINKSIKTKKTNN